MEHRTLVAPARPVACAFVLALATTMLVVPSVLAQTPPAQKGPAPAQPKAKAPPAAQPQPKGAPPAETMLQQLPPGDRKANADGQYPDLEQVSLIAVRPHSAAH